MTKNTLFCFPVVFASLLRILGWKENLKVTVYVFCGLSPSSLIGAEIKFQKNSRRILNCKFCFPIAVILAKKLFNQKDQL